MTVKKISTLVLWFLFNLVGFVLIYIGIFEGTSLPELLLTGLIYALGMTSLEWFIYHKYLRTDA